MNDNNMNDYNLHKHEAFDILQKYDVIPILISYLMYQDPGLPGDPNYNTMLKARYSFKDFSELLVKNNDELIEEICDAMKANGDVYRNLPDNTPDERVILKNKIKGDIFEIFTMFTLQYFQHEALIGVRKSTYEQIPDDLDKGLDFFGIHNTTGQRVFGQIKYRNPFAKPEHQIAFTFTTGAKLTYSAIPRGLTIGPDTANGILIYVCNNYADEAMHYDFKKYIGWTGTVTDEAHRYVKIIDCGYFQHMINYENEFFWKTFSDVCKIIA